MERASTSTGGQPTVLIVPGWNGSGPTHWQTLWELAHPEFRRVEQRDWHDIRRDEWIATLDSAVADAASPVILVAHSLGCIAVAHWAAANPARATRIATALLVAPPDLDSRPNYPATLLTFTPIPHIRLPFRSALVSSQNDPYCTAEGARSLAGLWGSDFVNAGLVGHINVDSGHGPWPHGERILAAVIGSAGLGTHNHSNIDHVA